jgi:putative endonuclease
VKEDRRALGAEGEARAARFLTRKGYRIIECNVRAGGVEMDIIASRGPLLVFVEVKTRRGFGQGLPEAAVDREKQQRLIRGASAWLQQNPTRARRIRFDVVSCQAPRSFQAETAWRIRHIEAAFDANG